MILWLCIWLNHNMFCCVLYKTINVVIYWHSLNYPIRWIKLKIYIFYIMMLHSKCGASSKIQNVWHSEYISKILAGNSEFWNFEKNNNIWLNFWLNDKQLGSVWDAKLLLHAVLLSYYTQYQVGNRLIS